MACKEFNLEEAKAGKPVVTRDGRRARIICFDANQESEASIIALIEDKNNNKETVHTYYSNGKDFNGLQSPFDLMMYSEEGLYEIIIEETRKQTFTFIYRVAAATKEEAEKIAMTSRRTSDLSHIMEVKSVEVSKVSPVIYERAFK